ncbi:hypothetical protein vseg_002757 [Gypsophila vaccaria]
MVYYNKPIEERESSTAPNDSGCCESKFAMIDFVILIAVLCAFGYLCLPYVIFMYSKAAEMSRFAYYILEEEIRENPMIYGSLGVSMVCVAVAAWAILMCTARKCRNPACRGLWKAAEFDIQLETEECVKHSNVVLVGVKKGLFELPRDHHRELEAELRKIAPANGRAVLVFRARCGCSVGRFEVPGPRRVPRKFKK